MAICAIILILSSAFGLLMALFINFGGFGLILRIGLPIGLKLMPLNDELMAWIDMPFPLGIIAKVKAARPLPPKDGSVGGGEVDLELTMAKWEDSGEEGGSTPKLMDLILIQETAAIDEVQHYQMVLSKMGWSGWNFVCLILVFIGIFGVIGGVGWKLLTTLRSSGGSKQEKKPVEE